MFFVPVQSFYRVPLRLVFPLLPLLRQFASRLWSMTQQVKACWEQQFLILHSSVASASPSQHVFFPSRTLFEAVCVFHNPLAHPCKYRNQNRSLKFTISCGFTFQDHLVASHFFPCVQLVCPSFVYPPFPRRAVVSATPAGTTLKFEPQNMLRVRPDGLKLLMSDLGSCFVLRRLVWGDTAFSALYYLAGRAPRPGRVTCTAGHNPGESESR